MFFKAFKVFFYHKKHFKAHFQHKILLFSQISCNKEHFIPTLQKLHNTNRTRVIQTNKPVSQ